MKVSKNQSRRFFDIEYLKRNGNPLKMIKIILKIAKFKKILNIEISGEYVLKNNKSTEI